MEEYYFYLLKHHVLHIRNKEIQTFRIHSSRILDLGRKRTESSRVFTYRVQVRVLLNESGLVVKFNKDFLLLKFESVKNRVEFQLFANNSS